MRELHTEIEIHATAERVWELLTDLPGYPQWNPFIRRASGRIEVGTRLEVYLQPPGGRGMAFRPTILKVEPSRELRWLGNLIIPGLFDGEHIFLIEKVGEERVRFIQREVFTGLLVPLLWRGLENGTRRGFEAMNHALKAGAEEKGIEL